MNRWEDCAKIVFTRSLASLGNIQPPESWFQENKVVWLKYAPKFVMAS